MNKFEGDKFDGRTQPHAQPTSRKIMIRRKGIVTLYHV
jgi:hypothetical protein